MNNGHEYLWNQVLAASISQWQREERYGGASREELTEKGSRKVSVLPCAKDFGECACFVDTTGLDVVKELGSSGRRFL